MGDRTRTLSEADSKALLRPYGVQFPPEIVAWSPGEAADAADELGYPVVAKLCGDRITHKTERGLVRLGLTDAAAVAAAAADLLASSTPDDGVVSVLVAPMLHGARELIAGLSRDPQFGMTVMVGLGGVLAEAVADVSIRLVPMSAIDAREMLDDLSGQALLDGLRGEPALDRDAMESVLLALSNAASDHPEIVSADLNPLIVVGGRPIAVDALVEIDMGAES